MLKTVAIGTFTVCPYATVIDLSDNNFFFHKHMDAKKKCCCLFFPLSAERLLLNPDLCYHSRT